MQEEVRELRVAQPKRKTPEAMLAQEELEVRSNIEVQSHTRMVWTPERMLAQDELRLRSKVEVQGKKLARSQVRIEEDLGTRSSPLELEIWPLSSATARL